MAAITLRRFQDGTYRGQVCGETWMVFKGDFRSSGGPIVWGFRKETEEPSGEWFRTKADAVAALQAVLDLLEQEAIERSKVRRILVCQHSGYSCGPGMFNVLWTLDGETWVAVRGGNVPQMNERDVETYLARTMAEEAKKGNQPEVRRRMSGIIPEDWCTPNTRVLA